MSIIFYDCGFNRGTYRNLLINQAKDKQGLLNMGIPNDLIGRDNSDIIYYAFEPNPDIIPFSKCPMEGVDIHNKAVWHTDGEILKFVVYGTSAMSSSLFNTDQSKNCINVETIDFAKFLSETCTKEDRVIVKLDIEGAEYEVLYKLISTGAVHLIDDLIIEFHKKGIVEFDQDKAKVVYNFFKQKEYANMNSLTAWKTVALCWRVNAGRPGSPLSLPKHIIYKK